jgi:hypothetical protein
LGRLSRSESIDARAALLLPDYRLELLREIANLLVFELGAASVSSAARTLTLNSKTWQKMRAATGDEALETKPAPIGFLRSCRYGCAFGGELWEVVEHESECPLRDRRNGQESSGVVDGQERSGMAVAAAETTRRPSESFRQTITSLDVILRDALQDIKDGATPPTTPKHAAEGQGVDGAEVEQLSSDPTNDAVSPCSDLCSKTQDVLESCPKDANDTLNAGEEPGMFEGHETEQIPTKVEALDQIVRPP